MKTKFKSVIYAVLVLFLVMPVVQNTGQMIFAQRVRGALLRSRNVVTRKDVRRLRKKIKRARRLMQEKRAFRFKEQIDEVKRSIKRIKRLNRRRKFRRAREIYANAMQDINRIIHRLKSFRRRRRRITNSREASNPRSKFRISYKKELRGFRGRFDRIRRRQRADYTFFINTRMRRVRRAFLNIYARTKNSKNFSLRILVNGTKIFEGHVDRFSSARRFKMKMFMFKGRALNRGKNTIRIVVVRPFRNFYLDIKSIGLSVHSGGRRGYRRRYRGR